MACDKVKKLSFKGSKAFDGAPPSHRRPAKLGRFLFGSAYYPEHWEKEIVLQDVERMKDAGFNVVRMGEFAWSLFEPEDGKFEFAFFDEAISLLGKKGINTILCTPTAAPPAWLVRSNPEILRVDADGRAQQHGSRQHCCHSNPLFRKRSRQISEALGRHYKDNPSVIGWQTDNEINCHFSECHCASCVQAFQSYLMEKYDGDIEELNKAWGTVFWNQTYKDFKEIPTPKNGKPTYPNPAHQFEYYKFVSRTVAAFQREQTAILRKLNSRWFMTHNGTMRLIDYRGEFTRDLDFLGYDTYPMFCKSHGRRAASHSFDLDKVRSYSGNFAVLEHQSGPGGQANYFHCNPEPGEMRGMACRSIARGADSLLFFRWRTCHFGAEQYWSGILDHDNVPRRRYDEVSRLGAEIKKLGPAILGSHVRVDCAVAAGDYDVSCSHLTYSLGLPDPDHVAACLHKALSGRGYAAGCVHPSDDLSGLKLLIIPHWAVFDAAWLPNLESFVSNGGTLVLGARTATRDKGNNVVRDVLPGALRALAGVSVIEYGRQNCPDERPMEMMLGEKIIQSDLWYEVLEMERDSKALARWSGRHVAGQAAISLRRLGKGSVIYVGSYLTEPLASALVPELAGISGLQPLWPDLPEGVSCSLRESGDKRIWFFINASDKARSLAATPPGVNLFDGARTKGGPLALEKYGVAVIQEP